MKRTIGLFSLLLLMCLLWNLNACTQTNPSEGTKEKVTGEKTTDGGNTDQASDAGEAIAEKTPEPTPEPQPEPKPEPTPDFPNVGKTKWSIGLAGRVKTIALSKDEQTLYVTSSSFTALKADNGDELFSVSNIGTDLSAPVVDPSNGWVYFGSDNNFLYAVDPKAKRRVWSFKMKAQAHFYPPAIGKDGTLFVVIKDTLYAFKDRKLKWQNNFVVSAGIVSHPTVDNDGNIYICGKDNVLYAVKPDGTQKWNKTVGSKTPCSGVAIDDDGTIYVGGDSLFAFNADGSSKWSKAITRYGAVTSTVSLHRTFLYFGTFTGKMYKANKKDGSPATLLWEDGVNVVVSGSVTFAPTIGATGQIYLGHSGPALEAYDPGRGRVLWSVSSRSAVTGHATLSKKGVIFLGTEQGTVYAVQTASPGLANSAWPRGYQNNQNTSQQR
jgi:outer membrane protein assembly factor BamB